MYKSLELLTSLHQPAPLAPNNRLISHSMCQDFDRFKAVALGASQAGTTAVLPLEAAFACMYTGNSRAGSHLIFDAPQRVLTICKFIEGAAPPWEAVSASA